MRLRQVALVAGKLEPVVDTFHKVLGLNVGYRDPDVGVFGLVNAVMPVGGDFLEVVEPVKDDASAGRYLKRRGGDAGYMVILQAEDALPHRERIAGQGVRIIWKHDSKAYAFTHFHPGDFGGVLASVDSVPNAANWLDPDGDWPPCGKEWRNHRSDPNVLGFRSVTIQHPKPAEMAARWAELLEQPLETVDGVPTVQLTGAAIRFVSPRAGDADGTGVIGLDVRVKDRDAVLARAKAAGVPVKDGTITICGTDFTLSQG
ncbi:VOC family protein [Zavarzinia sp. CC-PAN008]|uniref:VOC family protein n=1 Tax=Zavarzinia sp. CC-PAN008 TaxID=3243332 RepID=UPI003F74554E